MTLATAYAVNHGSTTLSGLANIDTQTNGTVDNAVEIGSPYPQFAVLRGQKPQVLFASNAVLSSLALTGSIGVDIDASNNLIAYYAAMDNGLVAASGHIVYTAVRGTLVPRRLSVSHQQSATLDMAALLYSTDGSTAPLTVSATSSLPSLPRNNVQHTIGKVTIGGVSYDDPLSVDVDFGNNIQTLGSGSNVWDKYLEQPGVQPTITISGLSAEFLNAAAIPLEGKVGTHSDTTIYLRKYSEDGILYVSDGTAEHIKLDAEGIAMVDNVAGQGSSMANLSVTFTCQIDNSGNAPIGVSTSVVIP